MIGDAWREIGAGGQVDGVSHAELLAAGGGILKIHDGRHEIVKPSMTDYPTSLPKAVPEGKRLVHNGVSAFLAKASAAPVIGWRTPAPI
jgi:hypothetical protein